MKYFCLHPWQGLEVDAQGNYRPCCRYSNPIAKSYAEYTASQELANIKQEFLAGKKPKGCDWCWLEERNGVESKRQLDWVHSFNQTIPNLDQSEITHLTITFGNTCNLACPICSSWSSSRWATEEKKLNIPIIHKHNKFYKESEFTNLVNSISTKIKRIEITGGEPFLTGTKEHLSFLQHLHNTNSDVVLCYTTNGTVIPSQELFDLWKNFKKVEIRISIDGCGSHYEYNRWPAKWSDLVTNIKQYQDYQSRYSNISLKVVHVVSIFTVYYVPEFLQWSLKNKLGKPHLQNLVLPDIYDMRVLPQAVKDKIVDRLSKYSVQSLLEHLTSADLSDKLNDALNMINQLDQQRKISFSETFPEFYQLLKESGCQTLYQQS